MLFILQFLTSRIIQGYKNDFYFYYKILSYHELNVFDCIYIDIFGECLPLKNSVVQLVLIHRVEFFNVYSKITLTINHNIQKWSQYKLIFPHIALYRTKDIYSKSRK